MSSALILFSAGAGALVVLTTLYVAEDQANKKLVLPSFRSWLDKVFGQFFAYLRHLNNLVVGGVTRFILLHGVHKILGSIVNYLVKLEQRVERKVWGSYRSRSRERSSRNHLDEIADHKQSMNGSNKRID